MDNGTPHEPNESETSNDDAPPQASDESPDTESQDMNAAESVRSGSNAAWRKVRMSNQVRVYVP